MQQPVAVSTLRARGLRLTLVLAGIGTAIVALALSDFSWGLFWAALIVQPINFAASLCIASRISILGGHDVRWWPAFKAVALAGTMLYLLPSRLSELVKPIYLAESCRLSFVRGLAVVGFERLSDILVVTVAVTIGAVLLADDGLHGVLGIWLALSAVCIVACAVLFTWPRLITAGLKVLPWPRLNVAIERLVLEASRSLEPRSFPRAVLMGLLGWSASFLMWHAFLRAGGTIPLPLETSFLVFLAGTIGLAIGVAPGGLGTYEAGIVLALNLHGYQLPEALALAVGSRVANLGFLPLVAIWVISRERIGVAGLAAKARQLLQKRPSETG